MSIPWDQPGADPIQDIRDHVAAWASAELQERNRTKESLLWQAIGECRDYKAIGKLVIIEQEGCAPAVASLWFPTDRSGRGIQETGA